MMLSSEDDTKLVVCGLPSTLAVDPWMNPEPIKVMGVSGDPTIAEGGEMPVNEGRGLDGGVVVVLEPPPAHPTRDVNRITAPMREM